MKRLWKVIPPCLSDVLGFEAVLNATEGLGIIDDPSRYKPIGAGRGGRDGFHGGHRQEDKTVTLPRQQGDHMWGNRPGGHGGHRGYGNGELRVVNTDIRNADIITGTEKKVLAAFEENAEAMAPSFVLLCHAPSSSMIGSDLETNADRISEIGGIPAAYVNIDGGRDYLYGISVTLEAMGRLLLEKRETIPGTVNLLGCNTVDWTEEMRCAAKEWLAENGFQVLSCFGMKESTKTLRDAAAAEKNLVVSEAGLRLARYMESEFGIPYAVGAPFGRSGCKELAEKLRGSFKETGQEAAGEEAVLIIGEQVMSNALRLALRERGYSAIRVLSLLEMDRAIMEPGDVKLSGEDDLADQLNAESVRLVLCDPDMKPLLGRSARWISLSNSDALSSYETVAPLDLVGDKLDLWLDKELNGDERQ